MPNMISTRYGGGGDVTTTAEIDPFSLPSGDFFDTMVKRRFAPRSNRVGPGVRAARSPQPQLPRPTEGSRQPAYMDELERLKAFDQYESTLKGAATRGTGFGPGMIPGMAVDPRLLPQRLLPSSSGGGQLFADAGPSGGQSSPSPGPSASLPGQYGSGQPDTGLQYMSPSERARWARLLGH